MLVRKMGIKYLVRNCRCDSSGKDEEGNIPLHLAAFSGSLDIVKYVIEEKKCIPVCLGRLGRSPLHNACGRHSSLAVVKYLVEMHECDPTAIDQMGASPSIQLHSQVT